VEGSGSVESTKGRLPSTRELGVTSAVLEGVAPSVVEVRELEDDPGIPEGVPSSFAFEVVLPASPTISAILPLGDCSISDAWYDLARIVRA
jgi:hypothetical protein